MQGIQSQHKSYRAFKPIGNIDSFNPFTLTLIQIGGKMHVQSVKVCPTENIAGLTITPDVREELVLNAHALSPLPSSARKGMWKKNVL